MNVWEFILLQCGVALAGVILIVPLALLSVPLERLGEKLFHRKGEKKNGQ